jgi:hypothetical protein
MFLTGQNITSNTRCEDLNTVIVTVTIRYCDVIKLVNFCFEASYYVTLVLFEGFTLKHFLSTVINLDISIKKTN